MTCTACSAHVEKAVAKVPGVHSVNVNLMANSMLVDYDSAAADPAALIRAVEEAGYGASLPGASAASPFRTGAPAAGDPMAGELRHMKFRLIVSFLSLIHI